MSRAIEEDDDFGFDEDDNQQLNRSLDRSAEVNPNFTHQRGEYNDIYDEQHRKMIEDAQTKQVQFDPRIGGNYLNVHDPSKPDYTPFYLMVTGHIQSGLMNDKDGVCCSYSF